MTYRFVNRQRQLPSSSEEIEARLVEHDGWAMTDQERFALSAILEEVSPECAIEVGTYKGGSLDVISKFSDAVYALDIDPSFRDERGHNYPNVEFVVGDCGQTLPALMDGIASRVERLSFVLIDADHTEDAVRRDINNVLAYKPVCPLYILMHDSFNPGCRSGILAADWASNPHVHLVEIDFVAGRLFGPDAGKDNRHMWCGFALAILLPEPRGSAPIIHENASLMFQASFGKSVHADRGIWTPRGAAARVRSALRSRGLVRDRAG